MDTTVVTEGKFIAETDFYSNLIYQKDFFIYFLFSPFY